MKKKYLELIIILTFLFSQNVLSRSDLKDNNVENIKKVLKKSNKQICKKGFSQEIYISGNYSLVYSICGELGGSHF